MKQGRKVSAIAVGLALSGLTSLSPAYAQQADEEAANLERIAVGRPFTYSINRCNND